MSASSLEFLPVEILFRIFDYLDIESIILSLRYVCKRFYSITDSYDRYDFDLSSKCKANIQIICRIVPFEHVIGLTLSDEDQTRGQIEYFLSLFRLKQFPRLQSLTLLHIENFHFNSIFNDFHSSILKSVRIDSRKHRDDSTLSSIHLSTIIAHRTLRKFQLDISPEKWNYYQWPMNESLSSLHLNHQISLDQFAFILYQSSHLRTFVLKHVPNDSEIEILPHPTYPQLTSLIFEETELNFDNITQCLSLTPSLTYLKLIGRGKLFNLSFDGHQWEKLIQTKLPQLRRFEFLFSILVYSSHQSRPIESLMSQYRTSFWLENLRCAIKSEYVVNSRNILLYTLPICSKHFVYHLNSKTISSTNFTERTEINPMENVTELEFQLTNAIDDPSIEEIKSMKPSQVLFTGATELFLGNDGNWPKNSMKFFSTMFDISQIVKLSLSINFLHKQLSDLLKNLHNFFSQAINLRSLSLFDYWPPDICSIRVKSICSLMMPHMKHLRIRVRDLNEIRDILEALQHLTSVTFEYSHMLVIRHQDFLRCLSTLNRLTSMWNSDNVLHIWLEEKKTAKLV